MPCSSHVLQAVDLILHQQKGMQSHAVRWKHHQCAGQSRVFGLKLFTLLQAVPYWVDDESVRASMAASGPSPPRSIEG